MAKRGTFFENNLFKGDKKLYSRFKEEIESCIRSSIGKDWWDLYMLPLHAEDTCLNEKFTDWPILQSISEGQPVLVNGEQILATRAMSDARRDKRKDAERHNKMILEKKEGMRSYNHAKT